MISEADRERLGAYVAHFNARDFDAIRAMITDDVRLDLVNKTRMKGKAETGTVILGEGSITSVHLLQSCVTRLENVRSGIANRHGCSGSDDSRNRRLRGHATPDSYDWSNRRSPGSPRSKAYYYY